MPREYIDQFFNSGQLRLSSFMEFSRHPNEQFRDDEEGRNVLCATGKDSTMYVASEHGAACYILSTSLLGPWAAASVFSPGDCFEITNPLGFASVIAASLNNCSAALVAPCSYVQRRVIQRHVEGYNFAEINAKGGAELLKRDAAALLQYSPMFQKPMKSKSGYESILEHEFRFIWETAHQVLGSVPVQCPEARQFCRKV